MKSYSKQIHNSEKMIFHHFTTRLTLIQRQQHYSIWKRTFFGKKGFRPRSDRNAPFIFAGVVGLVSGHIVF
jgi:hypothetical protein